MSHYGDYPFGEYGPRVAGTNYNAVSLWLVEHKGKHGPEKWTFDGYNEDQLRNLAHEFLYQKYAGNIPATVTKADSDRLSDEFESWLNQKAHSLHSAVLKHVTYT